MNNPVTRRDFTRLASAAFGGVITGAMLGCEPGAKDKVVTPKDGVAPKDKDAKDKDSKDKVIAIAHKHACRGLNECKGQGGDARNACAGQGSCANVAGHACGGHNECKGQGGCGETPGANECKGKGGCHVPMTGDMWTNARETFEARMKKASKTVGAAPAEKDAK